jgi:hypothetical protein
MGVMEVDVETIKINIVIVGTSISSAITMFMADVTAIAMTNAMVVVADMVGAVAMAAKTPKEITRIFGGRTNDTCQVCGKVGHIALNYWKRFQKIYRGLGKI